MMRPRAGDSQKSDSRKSVVTAPDMGKINKVCLIIGNYRSVVSKIDTKKTIVDKLNWGDLAGRYSLNFWALDVKPDLRFSCDRF